MFKKAKADAKMRGISGEAEKAHIEEYLKFAREAQLKAKELKAADKEKFIDEYIIDAFANKQIALMLIELSRRAEEKYKNDVRRYAKTDFLIYKKASDIEEEYIEKFIKSHYAKLEQPFLLKLADDSKIKFIESHLDGMKKKVWEDAKKFKAQAADNRKVSPTLTSTTRSILSDIADDPKDAARKAVANAKAAQKNSASPKKPDQTGFHKTVSLLIGGVTVKASVLSKPEPKKGPRR